MPERAPSRPVTSSRVLARGCQPSIISSQIGRRAPRLRQAGHTSIGRELRVPANFSGNPGKVDGY